jgi:hypothetical protein
LSSLKLLSLQLAPKFSTWTLFKNRPMVTLHAVSEVCRSSVPKNVFEKKLYPNSPSIEPCLEKNIGLGSNLCIYQPVSKLSP